MTENAILYSYWRSSCTWRVRIAMNLKGIPYDIKPVSLVKEEQHSDDYLRINPIGQVPSLKIDGITIVESLNILQYLEETRPQVPLLPTDIVARTKVREICEIIASGIQPLQNLVVLKYVGEDKKIDWAEHWITRGFRVVDTILSTSAGKYCVGDDITMADCCLIPQIYNAKRFNVDMTLFPNINKIASNLEDHPAFKEAHPNRQPDSPNI